MHNNVPARVTKRNMIKSNNRRGNVHCPEDEVSNDEGEVEVDSTRMFCGNTDAEIIRDNRFPPSPNSALHTAQQSPSQH
eukprot:11224794-Lingulodinium_polyedra.AAC.1